jgi:hypothetical protein
MRRLLFVMATACVLFTGCKKDVVMGNPQLTTLDVESLSAISVDLRADVRSWNDGPGWKRGFEYSTSADYSDSKVVDAYLYDKNLLQNTVIGLTPSTRYYYRAFLRQGSVYTYGGTVEFTTLPVSSLIETLDYALNEEEEHVTMNGKLSVSHSWYYYTVEYGFYVGASEGEMQRAYSVIGIPSDGRFSQTLHYNYFRDYPYHKAFIRLDDVTYFGEVKHVELPNP